MDIQLRPGVWPWVIIRGPGTEAKNRVFLRGYSEITAATIVPCPSVFRVIQHFLVGGKDECVYVKTRDLDFEV